MLITGNMGYVGPLVVKRLREKHPNAEIWGYDTAYFGDLLTTDRFPERYLDRQIYGDIRKLDKQFLFGVDKIVHLAALSNDPIGKNFEDQTYDINVIAGQNLVKMAKDAGVQSFVFASSCSVYGAAESAPRTESSAVAPLTAYAKSKVEMEKILTASASPEFTTTALRFATACGASPRLRLDLVLNDFVANAMVTGKIDILSDGTPWRPLINTKDMARAIDWALFREQATGGQSLIVNAGSNEWNYMIVDLARTVAKVLGNVEVSINQNAEPDKRSYRVDFSLLQKLAGDNYTPKCTLEGTIQDLHTLLGTFSIGGSDFRQSRYMRLKALEYHKNMQHINNDLYWL